MLAGHIQNNGSCAERLFIETGEYWTKNLSDALFTISRVIRGAIYETLRIRCDTLEALIKTL